MPEMCQFLQDMAISLKLQETDPVDIVISTLHLLEGFRKIPERTSLGPAGHHETYIMLVATDESLSHNLARAIVFPFSIATLISDGAQLSNSCWIKDQGNVSSPSSEWYSSKKQTWTLHIAYCWGKQLVHHAFSHSILAPLNFGGRLGYRAQLLFYY